MGPEALTQVLRPLQDLFPADRFPQVLVGLRPSDDAAVYQLTPDLALVATLDFFTPVVDDPYTFGAIAAANALSDVYAMGAKPALALNISCLSGALEPGAVTEIFRGGADKVLESGAVLVGGHSVDDKEPKYGLVAIGFIRPDRVWTKTAARPGDRLVLTKPIGVGVVTTALKRDLADPAHVEAATQSMLRLNVQPLAPFHDAGVRACTDVTGFAVAGSAVEIAERSKCRIRLDAARIPTLPGALAYAAQNILPGGTKRNRAAFEPRVTFTSRPADDLLAVLFTPETSGGLLACVPAGGVSAVLRGLKDVGVDAAEIGSVEPAVGAPGVEVV